MKARTFVVLLLVGLGLLVGVAWRIVDAPDGGAPSDDAATTVASLRGDAETALTDTSGAPLLRADGSPFPPGSRRDGRRIVTPDGRTWRRVAGAWVADPDHDADTGGRRRVDLAAARADEAQRQPAPPPAAPELPGSSGPTGARRPPVLDPANLRPAPGDTLTSTTMVPAAPPPGWAPADGTIAPTGSSQPRLDVRRDPESATSWQRDRVDDERAAVESAAVAAQHGLRGDYFDLLDGDIRDVPDLTGLTASFSRVDLLIDFDTDASFALPFEPETFAVRWTGWITIPIGGEYTFTCGSDDGARMTLGGEEVFAHRSLRPYAETSGTVTLDPGRHQVDLVFYENRVYASCRLYWSGPGFEREVVPSHALTPPDTLMGVVQPHVARIDPANARVGDVVTLTGVGFSSSPTADRVTFAGVVAEVVEARSDTLVVVVPIGAETGDVTVQVGELTSLPRRFTVDSLNGLFAEYFLIGQDLNVMPDLDALTPYFVRQDGPLDYHQDLLWELPYEPDVFAARYRGFLYVPEDDEYRVTLGSDDGALMTIDGVSYLDAPGLHPYREVTRTTRFTKGFHPIEITFFENRGVARLRLFWQRPHEPQRSVIPRGFLFPPEALASATPPTISPFAPAALGETITITGSGFGTDASLVRVRFDGDAWARPESVEPTRLTAIVPRTAGSGPLRVDVGVLSSNAVLFTRTTPMGLTADVYVFGSAAEVREARTPEAFGGRTPNLTRVDTAWRRETAADWNLPFPARNFAVHWSGTLGVDTAVDLGWILQADAGALLYVNGNRIVDNGPFHPLLERYGKTTLLPGDHRFDLWYFQEGGAPRLHLFWNPWGLQDHRDVPASWFRPAAPEPETE